MVMKGKMKMELKEKISKLFEGETDPNKLKELATALNDLGELERSLSKQKEDNVKLSKAYIDALKGATNKEAPSEDQSSSPTARKEISLEDGFASAMKKFIDENKE